MFAWYYLGYGSPDDEVSTLGVFSKIPIIGSALDAKNEDIALSILYSVYGIPDSGDWGDYPNKWNPNSANSYMTTGIMGYLNSLVVHTSNTVSWVKSVYERFGNVYDRLVTLSSDIWDTHRGVLDQFYEVESKLDSIDYALYGTDDAGRRQSLWELLYSSQHGIRAVLETVANTNAKLQDIYDVLSTSLDQIGGLLEVTNKTLEAINTKTLQIYNYLSSSLVQRLDTANKILEAINTKDATANTILEAINTKTLGIKNVLEQLIDTKLQKLLDKDFTADLTADLSPVTSRLDEIARLLSPSGDSDLLGAFVGDFTLPVSSALSAQVQSALQSAFPFCIPAIMKQVLGLLDVEPVAARVDYEIMGATVSLDFSAGGFAAQIALVTSWLCRILFVAMLLACSRNFIFAMPSKGG